MAMKTVLITGCRSGVGFELVKQILNHETWKPDIVIATCRKKESSKKLMELKEEHENLHILTVGYGNCDRFVSKVAQIVGENGLNVLVLNSGVYLAKLSTLDQVNEDQLLRHFKGNVVAPVMLTKALLPLIRTAASLNPREPVGVNRAAIFYLSSHLGSIGGNSEGGFWAYRESKAAANMAFYSIYHELEEENIAVMILNPGWVRSRLGGTEAEVLPEESVKSMMEVMLSLSKETNGRFVDIDGEELMW